jgi:glycosyltransferase involved in cell wall biosynthesis
MVAKNEALTIKECVESILPVLDELIITYQTSIDKTEEILKQLQEKYPDKLRIYHYKPYLPPYGRLADREESSRYPEGSIHNPSNYYNFGLVKHRFAYYMKVDGDQVYFTEKLQKMKDELQRIYDLTGWKRSRPVKTFFKALLLLNSTLNRFTPLKLFSVSSKFSRSIFARAYYPDFAYSMAGLNVYFRDHQMVIPVEPLNYNSGVGDHFILSASSKTIYRWSKKNLYEYFVVPKNIHIGFCWLHFKYIKIIMDGQFREAPGKAVTLDKCRTISANALLKKASSAKNDKRNRVRTTLVRHFWDQDKQYIPDLPELTEKVKYFFKKHAPDS